MSVILGGVLGVVVYLSFRWLSEFRKIRREALATEYCQRMRRLHDHP